MDCWNQINTVHKTDLKLRMRKGITLIEKPDALYIISDLPFSVLKIDRIWERLIKILKHSPIITLQEISNIFSHLDPTMIYQFIGRLVRKGILELADNIQGDFLTQVDIIIPVRNRADEISICLKSLLELDYPAELFKITVVDDASTDNTKDIVKGFGVNLIELREHGGISRCRNIGVQKTSGEIIAFIDSDCVAHRCWLRELVQAFQDPTVVAVGGRVMSWYLTTQLERYEAAMSSLNVSKRWKRSDEEDASFYVPSCNFLIRRWAFLELGGFDESLSVGEDVDLCFRLKKKGYVFEFRPQGVVYHKHRNSLKSFASRRKDYGTSEPLLSRTYRHLVKTIHVPALDMCVVSGILLATITKAPYVLVSSIFALLAGILYEFNSLRWLKERNLILKIIKHRLRAPFIWIYTIFSFYSRYYLMFGLVVCVLNLKYLLIALIPHVITGLIRYVIERPTINLLSFLFFFTVEQISYQLGVWVYCLKLRTLRPVNATLIFRLMC